MLTSSGCFVIFKQQILPPGRDLSTGDRHEEQLFIRPTILPRLVHTNNIRERDPISGNKIDVRFRQFTTVLDCLARLVSQERPLHGHRVEKSEPLVCVTCCWVDRENPPTGLFSGEWVSQISEEHVDAFKQCRNSRWIVIWHQIKIRGSSWHSLPGKRSLSRIHKRCS